MTWLALLLYASWTLLLLLAIGALRLYLSLTRQRAPNRFAPSGDDVSPFSGRLCRAHANCVENLPILTAVAVVAGMTSQTQVTEPMALPLVAARVAQSSTHLVSTSVPAVTIRFVFFGLQLAIIIYWVAALAAELG